MKIYHLSIILSNNLLISVISHLLILNAVQNIVQFFDTEKEI